MSFSLQERSSGWGHQWSPCQHPHLHRQCIIHRGQCFFPTFKEICLVVVDYEPIVCSRTCSILHQMYEFHWFFFRLHKPSRSSIRDTSTLTSGYQCPIGSINCRGSSLSCEFSFLPLFVFSTLVHSLFLFSHTVSDSSSERLMYNIGETMCDLSVLLSNQGKLALPVNNDPYAQVTFEILVVSHLLLCNLLISSLLLCRVWYSHCLYRGLHFECERCPFLHLAQDQWSVHLDSSRRMCGGSIVVFRLSPSLLLGQTSAHSVSVSVDRSLLRILVGARGKDDHALQEWGWFSNSHTHSTCM